MTQPKNTDQITRPAGSKRVIVQVRFRLSLEELRRAFVFFGAHHEAVLVSTPYVETLARNLNFVLSENGYAVLYQPQPAAPDVEDYALRCANRLWNSKRVKE